MSIAHYQANKILDEQFGGTTLSPIATLYVGLSTTAPSADGTGVTEPSGGAYARVSVTNNKTNWDTSALGILDNDVAIQFVESTASWGTITHVVIYDAVTAGNLLYWEALTSSRTVAAATTVLFAIGGLIIKMNNT